MLASSISAAQNRPTATLMSPRDLAAVPANPSDAHISYGEESDQFGELRVPPGLGPHPVVVLIHGGCFKVAYADLQLMAPLGDALKAQGIASWNIEYRRLGQPGGGWPGTHRDVGSAVDHLRVIAEKFRLDLNRVVVVGHSAGGHLAMWLAARSRLPPASDLYVRNPLKVRGVVDLAGPVDLSANIEGYESLCADPVITSLLGGTPTTVPKRYAEASPRRLLPLGVPQILVIGQYEEYVPRPIVEDYVNAARQAGDTVEFEYIPGVGHFEIANVRASTWPKINALIRSLMD